MVRRLTVAALAASTLFCATALAEGVAVASTTAPVTAAGQVTAASPQKCPANLTAATIGGQAKCLAPGQQCQQNNVKDYTKYGFTCSKSGNRYQLSKKGAAAKPKPAGKH
jgi:uncharacterized membrane protein